MKRVNFDGLKNITVPDKWTENALCIPETHSRKKTVLMFKLSRVITAAACFVLICVMSIPMYLFSRSGVDIPVALTTQVEDSTGEQSSENALEVISYSGDNSIPVFVDPTEKSSSESSSQNTGKTDPTEQAVSSQNTLPTDDKEELPTSTQEKTDPTEPTVVISTKPIQTEYPTGNWVEVNVVSCSGAFPAELLPESGKLYCRMYDSFGVLVGDSDPYSSQHRVTSISEINDYIFVSYRPKDKGLELQKGRYSYCFYTEGGTVVFEGSVLV